ncbi:uridine kinase [Candidatus Malacoplasma girerdii]|uniref:Uridine kinase n=1 Tax=Candidatus Malacoplasma girerdii TaxID=1318617 RepID=A0A097ST19_9BACT|nr:uridine kinase [Candidatus Malacoplasma girerdii]ASJ89242.1 MAG: uridine kinase [Candidatus Malacoplasma girerdii]
MKKHKPVLICVAGGTASGKTTVSKEIIKTLNKKVKTQLICIDSFYSRDLEKTKQNELHTNVNFDHPNAFDWPLIEKTFKTLLDNKTARIPIYDYKISRRSKETKLIKPTDVIIFEGILSLYNKSINKIASIKIYVDSPSDERFIRRFLRDKNERGRNDENIIAQWRNVVQPMYKEFIEPQKRNADLVIPWTTYNTVAIDFLKCALINQIKK